MDLRIWWFVRRGMSFRPVGPYHIDMNLPNEQATDIAAGQSVPGRGSSRDWPSILMLAAAAIVVAWRLWPSSSFDRTEAASIAVGKPAPPLRCNDPVSNEPMLALVPRGWFVWIVLAPDRDSADRTAKELALAETTWQAMADLDRWRRVVVATDETLAKRLLAKPIAPEGIPCEIGLARSRPNAAWGSAERVRHVLIEPTGRILMIEPAESDRPGSLEKIHQNLRRRLRQWEGEFDDLPRFS